MYQFPLHSQACSVFHTLAITVTDITFLSSWVKGTIFSVLNFLSVNFWSWDTGYTQWNPPLECTVCIVFTNVFNHVTTTTVKQSIWNGSVTPKLVEVLCDEWTENLLGSDCPFEFMSSITCLILLSISCHSFFFPSFHQPFYVNCPFVYFAHLLIGLCAFLLLISKSLACGIELNSVVCVYGFLPVPFGFIYATLLATQKFINFTLFWTWWSFSFMDSRVYIIQ